MYIDFAFVFIFNVTAVFYQCSNYVRKVVVTQLFLHSRNTTHYHSNGRLAGRKRTHKEKLSGIRYHIT
jgi:hypothetical protein